MAKIALPKPVETGNLGLYKSGIRGCHVNANGWEGYMMAFKLSLARSVLSMLTISTTAVVAEPEANCPVTPSALRRQLVAADTADTTGFNNHFWAVVVNREGVVCAVAFSGAKTGSQWLASRQIAAAKAFTANGLSLDIPTGTGTGTGALSTAQLYQFVQPVNPDVGNPLFGLESGNVIDSEAVYQGNFESFGTAEDPMIGHRVGGTISFGGGLGLYRGTTIVGGIGLSGDTACADHSVAWRTRILLNLQQSNPTDKLKFQTNATTFDGHPRCPNDEGTQGAIFPLAGP